jgi:hypothetical protein
MLSGAVSRLLASTSLVKGLDSLDDPHPPLRVPDDRPTVEILTDLAAKFVEHFGEEAEFLLEPAENTVETARQQVEAGNPNWTPEQTRALTRSVARADRRVRAARSTVRPADLAAALHVRAVHARRGATRSPRGRRVRSTAAASRDGPSRSSDDDDPDDVVPARREAIAA